MIIFLRKGLESYENKTYSRIHTAIKTLKTARCLIANKKYFFDSNNGINFAQVQIEEILKASIFVRHSDLRC